MMEGGKKFIPQTSNTDCRYDGMQVVIDFVFGHDNSVTLKADMKGRNP